jgi:hypothetical protein
MRAISEVSSYTLLCDGFLTDKNKIKMAKKYFVDIFNDCFCYTKERIIDMMKVDGIKEVKAYEALREINRDFFWCNEFGEVGEKGQSCGKQCGSYEPRNGKNGCCKHVGHLYVKGEELTLSVT